MSSSGLGIIVYVVRFGNTSTLLNGNIVKVFERVGQPKQTEWQQTKITLNTSILAQVGEIQIILEGQIKSLNKGLIAIDDIIIEKGACSSNQYTCFNGTVIPSSKICDFVKDCSDGSDEHDCGDCNFESGNCGWTDWKTPDFKISSADSLSKKDSSAPNADADGKTSGHYLYIQGSGGLGVSQVALNYNSQSNWHKKAYKTCSMQFDYFINTTDKYIVQVTVGSSMFDQNTVYYIQPEPSYRAGWRKAQAHIGEMHDRFVTAISAQFYGHNEVLAIDNIEYINCKMPPTVRSDSQCPSANPVRCKNTGYCISKDNICDWKNDCGDRWDEYNCPTVSLNCNFEDYYSCKISTDQTENPHIRRSFAWVPARGVRNTLLRNSFAPRIDNTR